MTAAYNAVLLFEFWPCCELVGVGVTVGVARPALRRREQAAAAVDEGRNVAAARDQHAAAGCGHHQRGKGPAEISILLLKW